MTVPGPDLAWSTWDPRYPACMIHLPSRFAIRVTLFSATENRYDDFPAERQLALELGERGGGGEYASLRARSAGTTLQIEFARENPLGVCGRVTIVEPGEMLFRLGILVEAGFLAPAGPDPREPAARMVGSGADRELTLLADSEVPARMSHRASARWGSRRFAVAVAPTPALAGQYARPADVADDLEHRGWLYHPPPRPDGDWIAYRFYGNPRETVTFAVGEAGDPAEAASAAGERLAGADAVISRRRAAAREGGSVAARAIRDVMAWNTVWDSDNERPYTALSRGWLRGFGGWGIWMSDAFYNALLCARAGEASMARANIDAVLAAQQPAGNIPCLVGADEQWVDRTQLPVGAFMIWRTYLLLRDRSLLSDAYPALARHLNWLVSERDGNANGLYEYGSSPIGHAQGAFTKQGALNESGMDNLAVFDDATFIPDAHTIDLEEPGHNSLIALEWEMLGRIAGELGLTAQAAEHLDASRALALRISQQLWDPAREIFAARHWDGSFATHIAPTSFFPLVAGAASEAQIDAVLSRWLLSEEEFWGELPLPTAPWSDPVGLEDSYWRGRIWPPLNYWTWEGLRRAGRGEAAAELARRSWAMYETEWTTRRHSHENFNSRDATRHEAHDSDPFYSWGALIPFMWEAEHGDASPWDGVVLAPGGSVAVGDRTYAAVVTGDIMSVEIDGVPACSVSPPRRITDVEVTTSGEVRYQDEPRK